jgi:hypothetical protein
MKTSDLIKNTGRPQPLEGEELAKSVEEAIKPLHPIRIKRPTKCRVSLGAKDGLAIIGHVSAFDAEYDWDLHVAFGKVDGYDVMVPKEQGKFTFYKGE